VEIWAGVVGSGASKSIAITLAGSVPSGDADNIIVDIYEYSGPLATGFLDQTASAYQTGSGYAGSGVTGTTSTTTAQYELVIGAIGATAADPGYTAQSSPTPSGTTLLDGAEYNPLGSGFPALSLSFLELGATSTGSYQCGTSFAAAECNWAGCIATFILYVQVVPILTVTSSVFIIYPSGGSATPKSGTITATLMNPSTGEAYTGKTVSFSTSSGSVSPASATTNSSGVATTTLSSGTGFGLAVVEASWAGDSTVPAANAFVTVHVFYAPESGNSAIPFQMFVEGYPLKALASGTYTWNYRMLPGQFQIQIPTWDSNIVVNGLVGIYRLGVLEYRGVLQRIDRTLGDQPTVTLSGVDASWLLATRVIDSVNFSNSTPQAAISSLLSNYYCGVTAGTMNSGAANVSLNIDTESLQAAIARICDMIGWVYRVNTNLTLDFESAFGRGLESVSFVEGSNLLTCSTITDYSTDVNVLHMRGGQGLRAVVSNTTSVEEVGLLEGTNLQPTITSQTALNTAATAALNNLQNAAVVTITLEGNDKGAAPGTFLPEDQVTVTSPTLGLSGGYTVAQITRDVGKPTAYCNLQLNGLLREFLLLDEQHRRVLHDLAVA
jgi:hypothetical protein